MTTPSEGWDSAYQAGPPPWDIGRPQPAFIRLAGSGLLSGRVLDAGCGTGEHVLLAAAHGAQAMGVDVSALAIEKARGKPSSPQGAPAFEFDLERRAGVRMNLLRHYNQGGSRVLYGVTETEPCR